MSMIYTTNKLYHIFNVCTVERLKYHSYDPYGIMKETLVTLEVSEMNMPLVLLIVGLITIGASFFVGSSTRAMGDELENVSISLHQETSNLKKRIRVLEEELMIVTPTQDAFSSQNFSASKKPIHAIIVSQIISLHDQGYTVPEIAKRSSLDEDEVLTVLRSKGVRI